VREGVSLQKVTKLIVDGWLGDRPEWQKRCPDHQNQRAQSDPTHCLVASQIGKHAQKSLPQMVPAGGRGFRDDTENSDQDSAIDELMQMVPAGGRGFRDDTENSDQDSAIDELMAMHVGKNELFIINKALALAALARIESARVAIGK